MQIITLTELTFNNVFDRTKIDERFRTALRDVVVHFKDRSEAIRELKVSKQFISNKILRIQKEASLIPVDHIEAVFFSAGIPAFYHEAVKKCLSKGASIDSTAKQYNLDPPLLSSQVDICLQTYNEIPADWVLCSVRLPANYKGKLEELKDIESEEIARLWNNAC